MTDAALVQESARMRPYYQTAEDYPGLLLDDELALCDRSTFEALRDYSVSYPSGQFLGKVWKRGELRLQLEDGGPRRVWYLGEYVPHDDAHLIGVKWRRLELVE